MRKALVVGIDYYSSVSHLHGCVNDAHAVKSVLERHTDGSVNFDVKLLSGTGPSDTISRSQLKDAVKKLFSGDSETALFYFAGHGFIEVTGGYLITSECTSGDDGLSLNDVLIFANTSAAKNKVIILDSCHSGVAGSSTNNMAHSSELAEGITILTASTADQYASEQNGSGVFTALLVDALSGAAANLVGEITPGSVYAHIDQSLGPWEQRPVFKTNVKSFVSLRRVQPPIELASLRRICELFPSPGFEFPLDPSYEPEIKGREEGMPPPDPENTRTFAVLQKYNRLNLLVPVNAMHMWNAAMESKACRLTALGEHYRRLVENNRI
jgi:hypothetical protein